MNKLNNRPLHGSKFEQTNPRDAFLACSSCQLNDWTPSLVAFSNIPNRNI